MLKMEQLTEWALPDEMINTHYSKEPITYRHYLLLEKDRLERKGKGIKCEIRERPYLRTGLNVICLWRNKWPRPDNISKNYTKKIVKEAV